MSAHPIRDAASSDDELVLDQDAEISPEVPEFDVSGWHEVVAEETPAAPAARKVLGIALGLIAVLWLGYVAWTAGVQLGSDGIASPAFAQWLAVASAPLALMALAWIMFGRTRRRESEAFTRSVISMKGETRALEVQLMALTRAIADGKAELSTMMSEIDRLSTERAEKLAAIAGTMSGDARTLAEQGDRLDQAAARARADMDALLDGMPRAEQHASALAQQIENAGTGAQSHLEALHARLAAIGSAGVEAERKVREASDGLASRLDDLQQAGSGATQAINEADNATRESVETLMSTSADALGEIRSGIDTQSAAVAALISQSKAGLQRTGADAALELEQGIAQSDSALAALTDRIAAQDASAKRMLTELDRGLAVLDQRYAQFAADGDGRAQAIIEALGAVRERLNQVAGDHVAQTDALDGLSHRTREIKSQVDALSGTLQNQLLTAFHDAETGAGRLISAAEVAGPMAIAVRDATLAAADKMGESADLLARSQQSLAGLDEGVSGSAQRLTELRAAIAATRSEADALTGETGPALVDALVRVREAAANAGERARSAIEKAIADSAGDMGDATAKALQKAFREQVVDRLAEVDRHAARAIDSARAAGDRLSAQMISIGQTASALEDHMTEMSAKDREGASEDFARRVAVLMESMNSAAIDVGKILSEDVDEKSWNAYLKGERGVFTRRAVKLLSGSEARAIGQHYEGDPEFRDGANRYIHDFEAMLRRVLAERDGEIIAVTLMSSDMGKLYAALGQAIERKL